MFSASERVPEAYRQKFQTLKRQAGQTFVEFAREDMSFYRWYRSLQVDRTYGNQREVILMEEFKNSLPLDIRTRVTDHKVGELKGAAISADDYELTHKRSIGLPH